MGLELHWLRPAWLLALPALALLFGLILWRARRASRWESLVDPALRPLVLTGGARSLGWPPLVMLGLAWLLLVLALAGPAWQRGVRPVFRIEQPRVLLLDLSDTLRARDVAPTRLARARFEVMDLLNGTDEGQFALVAFGAEPFLIAPLTTDAATVSEQVPLLAPDVLPLRGERRTDLALRFATNLLRRSGAAGADVLLITDAVGASEQAVDAAASLGAAGHRVSVLAIVPNSGFEALARAGGGVVVAARADDLDTQRLLALQGDTDLDGETEQATLDRQWRDDGPWLLLLVLPLAALAFRRGWIGLWPVALLLMPPQPVQAAFWDDLWLRPQQQALRDAAAGRLDAALMERLDPGWRAALRHAAGDFEGALQELSGRTGARAHYNRGNLLARLGRVEEAVAEYDAALEAQPGHADARHNRELLLELMRTRTPPPILRSGDGGGSGSGSGDADHTSTPPGVSDSSAARRGDASSAIESAGDLSGTAGTSEGSASARSDAGRRASDAAAELSPPPTSRMPERGTSDRAAERQDGAGSVVGQTPDARLAPEEAPDARQAEADAYLLRQVPDEPGRLLRERLMLQYLRRHGQLH